MLKLAASTSDDVFFFSPLRVSSRPSLACARSPPSARDTSPSKSHSWPFCCSQLWTPDDARILYNAEQTGMLKIEIYIYAYTKISNFSFLWFFFWKIIQLWAWVVHGLPFFSCLLLHSSADTFDAQRSALAKISLMLFRWGVRNFRHIYRLIRDINRRCWLNDRQPVTPVIDLSREQQRNEKIGFGVTTKIPTQTTEGRNLKSRKKKHKFRHDENLNNKWSTRCYFLAFDENLYLTARRLGNHPWYSPSCTLDETSCRPKICHNFWVCTFVELPVKASHSALLAPVKDGPPPDRRVNIYKTWNFHIRPEKNEWKAKSKGDDSMHKERFS